MSQGFGTAHSLDGAFGSDVVRGIIAGRCNTAPMHWTAGAVADAVGGVLRGPDTNIDSVSQDTREITPDGRYLFVPIVADRDGHDFIPAAIEAGAAAYLTSRPADPSFEAIGDLAAVEVDDTSVALIDLGRAARSRLDSASVIAVTGSVGKTTTKDFLAAVARTGRLTHANLRSFNNEIGVPLTLLGAPENAEVVIIEMGSRGMGDIARLCEIVRPTTGVVTTVGGAHTSEFGTVEAVARAKAELVEALPASGLAVLNADVELVAGMAERTKAAVVTFGVGNSGGRAPADVRAERIELDDQLAPSFTIVASEGEVRVRLGARGAHLVSNAVAAAAVGLHLGLSLDQIAEGLATPIVSPMRMELVHLSDGVRVIDDSYNANPMSTEAALRSLNALPATRRVAVLGVMAELGEESDSEHARIGELADALGIDLLTVDAPAYAGHDLDSIEDAVAALADLPAGSAILVKGSRVAGLERLVERLRSADG